jgi:cytidine deaminase
MKIEDLISMAAEARRNAYVPYSKFRVGAALLMEDGSVYTGCNVENASYGATNCAERTAIFKAVSEGHRKIRAICIMGSKEGSYAFPCGICRQVISEFSDDDTKIIVAQDEENYLVRTVGELLPEAFTTKDL